MEYLTDGLIEESNTDQFGHLEIAKEIRKIITNAENLDKSITIGIFGKWGVGKSSVIQLLRHEELLEQENDIVYIDIPIWKYTDPKSIRRKFIYQIAKRLNQEDEIKKIYYDVTTEGSVTFLKKIIKVIKELQSDVEKLLFYFLVTIIIGFLIYAVVKEINLNSFLLFYNSAISIAIVGFIIKLIQDIKFSKTSETQKVYEGEEQFEHLVEECLKKSTEKKIFIIDDLDRCDSSKILSVFEVIKNFISINNCVFIIACDPDVIRKAIDNETNNKTSENSGIDTKGIIHSKNSGFYLEKIFQYVIEIPGFLYQNMRDYAKNVIIDSGIELFKDNFIKTKLDRIIYTLIYKDTFNPRKVKTLVNRFILNYNLALKLEDNKKSFLTKGILTAFPERLALFSVIKSDFPHIIDKLKEAPSFNFRLWVEELENQDDFKEYIKQNQELFEGDWSILPFLYFNNDPSISSLQSTQLENLPILSSSLRNGNINTILEYLKSAKDIEDFIHYSYYQIEILNNTVEINNAVKIVLFFFEKIDYTTILIERNDVAETKLLQNINNQIRSKSVFHNGLIAYIAFLLIHSTHKGIKLLESYLENNNQIREESIDIIFSEKYFKIYNEKAKNLIIKYLAPTKENLNNIISLISTVNVNVSNYIYFEKGFYELSAIYNETLTGEIPQNDIKVIEPIYFKILKLSLKFNSQDFSNLLQPVTPLKNLINEFESDLQGYPEDGIDIFVNGIIKHCDTNKLQLIQDSTLKLFTTIVQTCKIPINLEPALDLTFSKEIEDSGLYTIDIETISMLLNFISLCKEKLNYQFHNTKITLQQTIIFEEDYPISLTLFNWVKTNYNEEFDPTQVIEDAITNVFNNPAFLRSSVGIPNLAIDYFDYLNFYLRKGIDKNAQIKIESAESITNNHTLSQANCKQFSIEFFKRLFDLMVLLQKESKANYEKNFLYVLNNYTSYQPEIIDFAIIGLLSIIDLKNAIFDGKSNEVKFLNAIINDTKIHQKIRYKIFVYRSLVCDTWWPEDDIKWINLVTEYHPDLPQNIKESFLNDTEKKLNRILSPKNWGKVQSWEKYVFRVCNCFFNISKIHQINFNRLFISVDDALEYYVDKKGYIETIITLLKVLNADYIPKDINLKKTALTKSMRSAIKKYKKVKNGLGPILNDKFDLKIGRNLFK